MKLSEKSSRNSIVDEKKLIFNEQHMSMLAILLAGVVFGKLLKH